MYTYARCAIPDLYIAICSVEHDHVLSSLSKKCFVFLNKILHNYSIQFFAIKSQAFWSHILDSCEEQIETEVFIQIK